MDRPDATLALILRDWLQGVDPEERAHEQVAREVELKRLEQEEKAAQEREEETATRRTYRDLLFTRARELQEVGGAAINFDETWLDEAPLDEMLERGRAISQSLERLRKNGR